MRILTPDELLLEVKKSIKIMASDRSVPLEYFEEVIKLATEVRDYIKIIRTPVGERVDFPPFKK